MLCLYLQMLGLLLQQQQQPHYKELVAKPPIFLTKAAHEPPLKCIFLKSISLWYSLGAQSHCLLLPPEADFCQVEN